MKEYLQKCIDEAESNEIAIEGKCHDCECDVSILVNVAETGETEISGGRIYRVVAGAAGEKKVFLKCDACFEKDSTLRNFRECEVFSRVVGFLRPVKLWNKGKKAEFATRKNFKVQGYK